ncbi:putative secondary metabolism biosynthetic enzyme [Arachnomyces sp. PD_36]|nr:putative secondary metabolism biosynthetic enzyme [Arachnomyces sp. PD_36]
MFEDAPNPIRVQPAPQQKRENSPTPLVLIHDGSGTTFSYFILGDLQREVWAIHNPYHDRSMPLEGGINEMARHYIDLMQAAGISGRIFLGGWSFGGYVSLAMARILAGDISSSITVAGLLIIDSAYYEPLPETKAVNSSEMTGSKNSTSLPEGLPEETKKSFEACGLLLDNWELPKWDGPSLGGKGVQVSIAGSSSLLERGTSLHKPVAGSWATIDTATYHQPGSTPQSISPPPAVAIRCTRPTPGSQDQYDNERLLGWEGRYPDFIKAVIDVDAEHYTLFDHVDEAKMSSLTAQLNEAMEMLESIRPYPSEDTMDMGHS